MANCVTCKARCDNAGQHRVKTDCVSYISKDYPKPLTNADRIRAMTDEGLAKFLMRTGACFHDDCDYCNGKDCDECWLDWLKQEAKE